MRILVYYNKNKYFIIFSYSFLLKSYKQTTSVWMLKNNIPIENKGLKFAQT